MFFSPKIFVIFKICKILQLTWHNGFLVLVPDDNINEEIEAEEPSEENQTSFLDALSANDKAVKTKRVDNKKRDRSKSDTSKDPKKHKDSHRSDKEKERDRHRSRDDKRKSSESDKKKSKKDDRDKDKDRHRHSSSSRDKHKKSTSSRDKDDKRKSSEKSKRVEDKDPGNPLIDCLIDFSLLDGFINVNMLNIAF